MADNTNRGALRLVTAEMLDAEREQVLPTRCGVCGMMHVPRATCGPYGPAPDAPSVELVLAPAITLPLGASGMSGLLPGLVFLEAGRTANGTQIWRCRCGIYTVTPNGHDCSKPNHHCETRVTPKCHCGRRHEPQCSKVGPAEKESVLDEIQRELEKPVERLCTWCMTAYPEQRMVGALCYKCEDDLRVSTFSRRPWWLRLLRRVMGR